MGNALNSNFNTCCTKDDSQTKKEVNWEENQLNREREGHQHHTRKMAKTILETGAFDLPFKGPDSLNFEINSKPQSQMLDRIKYLQEAAVKAPKLVLKVISSTVLRKDETIRINAQGAEKSLRGKKDGITYFGCKKKSKPLNDNFEAKEIINDVLLRNKDPDTNNRHRGRHFQIEYSIESNSYKIRDLGIGFGAFKKIDQPIILRDNNLIAMGSSFLIINFNEEQRESLAYSNSQDVGGTDKKSNLNGSPYSGLQSVKEESSSKKAGLSNTTTGPDITIKIFGGPNYGDVYQFNALTTPIIKIGRMPECEIKIEDNLLSKYQGTVKFIPNSGWTMFDGFNSKSSTNSNWLYLNDDFEVHHNMVFKANHTLFKVLIEP